MVIVASAMVKVLENIYHLRNPTGSWRLDEKPRPTKKEAVEALILGITKTIAVFSIYGALYFANSILERRELKVMAWASAFCVYPLAALDFQGICGVFELYTCFSIHGVYMKEINNVIDKIWEQMKSEGCRFYNYWDVRRWFWGIGGPPETVKRGAELIEITRNTPEWTLMMQRLRPSIKQAWELGRQGLARFGISFIAAEVLTNFYPSSSQLFWLDRKMVDFSKWLAPRVSSLQS